MASLREYGYEDITAVDAFIKDDFSELSPDKCSILSLKLDFVIQDVPECQHIYLGNSTYGGSLENVTHVPLSCSKIDIENLCFRKKFRNALVELAVLLSHLSAIYRAVHDGKSKYALILEDDFVLPFHFNISRLLQTAPKGFAMLQLVTSERGQIKHNLDRAIKANLLFRPRAMHTWCLGAYLIDTNRFQPFIDAVFTSRPGQTKLILNLFILHLCDPKGRFLFPSTCSPYRFAADYTLYHVFQNDTYISTYPFAESINRKLRNRSTGVRIFNKERGDESNLKALATVNAFVLKMKNGEIRIPEFVYQRRALS